MKTLSGFFILQFFICELLTDEYDRDFDEFKRKLVIDDFKNKLIQYLKPYQRESVLTGVSYENEITSRIDKNERRILNSIEEIIEVPPKNLKNVGKIVIPGIKVKSCSQRENYLCVDFLLPNNFYNYIISSAKYILAIENPNKEVIKWKISLLNNDSKKNKGRNFSFFYKTRPIYGGLHEIKSLDLVKDYFQRYSTGEKYIKLRLKGKQSHKKTVSIKTIILILELIELPKRNRRHATMETQVFCTNTTIYCCMKNFTITPADLNLQNLLSPEVIHLNYCRGECNHYAIKKSNHIQHLFLLKSSKTSRLSPRQLENIRSCCTPMSYKPLLIQYREFSQSIRKVEISDMIVMSCGCN